MRIFKHPLRKTGLLFASVCSLLKINRYMKEPQVSILNSSQQPPQNTKKKIILIGGGIAGCSSAYFLNKFHDSSKIEMILLQKEKDLALCCTYQNGRHAAANVGVFYPIPLSDLVKAYFQPKNETKMYLNPMIFFEYGGVKFLSRFLKKRYFGDGEKGLRGSILLEERCNQNFIPVVDSVCAELKIEKEKDLFFFDSLENKIFAKDIKVKILEQYTEFSDQQIKEFCKTNFLKYSPERFPRLLSLKNSRIIESRFWARQLFRAASLAQNITLKTNCRVTNWIKSEKTGKIIGVKTETGQEIYGDQFVIANGMETKFLTKPFNLSIPMLGGKGYSLNFVPKPGKQAELPPITSTFVDYTNACYINTTKSDLRATGTFEFTTYNDTHPTPEKIERLINLMKQSYTMNLDDFEVQKWACLRPMTPDEIPIVGSIEGYDNIYIHSGLGARGTNHSMMTAELLAAQMTGKEVPHKEEVSKLFSPSRFKSFL